jgi:hypothetical protein
MSDPVTNAEIEDVLTAVRRLVTSGGETRHDEAPSGRIGKLVLTPAFRVDLDETPEPSADPDPAPRDPNASSLESLVQDAIGADHDAPAQAQPAEDDSVREEDSGDDMSLEDRIAELEAVVTSSEDEEWDAEEDETEEAPTAGLHRLFAHRGGDTDEAPMADMVEAPDPDPVGVGEAVEIDVQAWEDVEEGDDTPTFRTASDEADDSYEDTDYSAEIHELSESYRAPAEVDDDMVIDEDMLREIVGRLVREELQGTMGERITRNLRRMVRREIARAMALKDLD